MGRTEERRPYRIKRAEALRELRGLRSKLLAKNCSVHTINYAYHLQRKYNLGGVD